MKRIVLTAAGILFFAVLTFAVLSAFHKPSPVTPAPTMTAPVDTRAGYSATGPKSPKKDDAGNITCEANPESKGMVIQTATTDTNGQPATRTVQC